MQPHRAARFLVLRKQRRWEKVKYFLLHNKCLFASVCMRVRLCVSEHVSLIDRSQEAVICYLFL